MSCGIDASQEREAYHGHECPVCGAHWIHGSRRCDIALESRCMSCGEESSMYDGGPGKIDEPEEEPTPVEEPVEEGEEPVEDPAEVK